MPIDSLDPISRTAPMTVDGFEHLGILTVRPRRVSDEVKIDMLGFQYLKEALGDMLDGKSLSEVEIPPSVQFRANTYAIARLVILDPPGLVDRLLNSDDPLDQRASVPAMGDNGKPILNEDGTPKIMQLSFFESFLRDYWQWNESLLEDAREKKSGSVTAATGNESVSSSAIATDSPQPTLAG